MVPRKYIDELTKAINDLSADERKRLGDALEKVDLTDVAIARDAITNIMETFCGAYTDMAAVLGAEFYDGIRELELGEKIGAVAESGRNPEATAGAVRALIQDVVDGKPREVFIGKLLDRADKEIRRASNVCIARNAKLDKKKIKYARVPSGSETCRFCIMLASRGAVYNNEKAASHSHANCDCRAVPDFGKGIEGYDQEYYKDVYVNPENHPEVNEAINARRRELYAEKKSNVSIISGTVKD